MKPRGTWLDGNTVHLDDAHGWPTHIPATRLPEMLGQAKRADDGRTMFALRWFDRDALQGAYDLLPQCEQCHEAPAFNPMGDDERMWCDACCASAAGSKYDDKEVLQ